MLPKKELCILKGQKKAFKFMGSHFGKYLLKWISIPFLIFSIAFPFLLPIYQRQNYHYLRTLSLTNDSIFSKSFDDSDNCHSYFTLLMFDVLLGIGFLCITVILGLIGLLVYFISTNFATGMAGTVVSDPIFFLSFVPSALICVVILFACVYLFQIGGFIASKNPDIGLGDLFFNSFSTLNKTGVKQFFMSLFQIVIIILFLALIVGVFILVCSLMGFVISSFPVISAESFIVMAIELLAAGVIGILFGPALMISWELSLFYLIDNCASAGVNTILYPSGKDESTFIKISPIDDENEENTIDLTAKDK
ncbi:MAG: hypothetical protein WCR67_04575 [Bacilli bacterium]